MKLKKVDKIWQKRASSNIPLSLLLLFWIVIDLVAQIGIKSRTQGKMGHLGSALSETW